MAKLLTMTKHLKNISAKTLIVCPNLFLPGGIASYYGSIADYLKGTAHFFYIGAKSTGESFYQKPMNLFRDLINFSVKLFISRNKFNTIILNPSLIPYCVIREGLLLCIAKANRFKCIVFFHGWDNSFAKFIERFFFKLFKAVFNQADEFIVLSNEFEAQLRSWGFNQPVHIETTTVDDRILKNYSVKLTHRSQKNITLQDVSLLFLSRVEQEKGIFETIDATKLLKAKYHAITLHVAGIGASLESAKKYTASSGLSDNVIFHGWVSGQSKADLLNDSDIMILPSSREGMPTCVLEAMAFGLPVLTTPVGGINDFFEDGRFGYLIQDKTPVRIAELVEKIISDDKLYHRMSSESLAYAHERFLSNKVANRFIQNYCG